MTVLRKSLTRARAWNGKKKLKRTKKAMSESEDFDYMNMNTTAMGTLASANPRPKSTGAYKKEYNRVSHFLLH